jgi:hypothetical protein
MDFRVRKRESQGGNARHVRGERREMKNGIWTKQKKGGKDKNELLNEIRASQLVNLSGNRTDTEKMLTWPEWELVVLPPFRGDILVHFAKTVHTSHEKKNGINKKNYSINLILRKLVYHTKKLENTTVFCDISHRWYCYHGFLRNSRDFAD